MIFKDQPATNAETIVVKRGAMKTIFTRKQWDDLGPDKGGWAVDDSPTPEMLEARQKKAEREANEKIHSRGESLIGMGYGYHEEQNAFVFSTPAGVSRVSMTDVKNSSDEVFDTMLAGLSREKDLLQRFSNPAPVEEPVKSAPAAAVSDDVKDGEAKQDNTNEGQGEASQAPRGPGRPRANQQAQ